MYTTQTTLTDTDAPDADAKTASDYRDTTDPTRREHPAHAVDPTLAPPEQRGGEDCCPWCLAAPETFEHHDNGLVGCGYCDAVIPVGADWFEYGEKIIF